MGLYCGDSSRSCVNPKSRKMKQILVSQTVKVPEGVTLKVNARTVTCVGPRGKLIRSFKHLALDMQMIWKEEGDCCCQNCVLPRFQHDPWCHQGIRIQNAHCICPFPHQLCFIRKVKMMKGVTVVNSTAQKDELILSGNDIEAVSQSAAFIQQSVKVKNKDIRKFLDGIYVSEKGSVVKDE